jgi:hypothetical protein
MREAARAYKALGHRIGLAYRTHLAEALLRAGAIEEGLEEIEAILAHAGETREHSHLADVTRLKGEALALLDRPAEGRASLLLAFDLASEQGAPFFQLRAAASLVELSAAAAGRATAEDLARLAAVHAAFVEGRDLPDLCAARQLLADGGPPRGAGRRPFAVGGPRA